MAADNVVNAGAGAGAHAAVICQVDRSDFYAENVARFGPSDVEGTCGGIADLHIDLGEVEAIGEDLAAVGVEALKSHYIAAVRIGGGRGGRVKGDMNVLFPDDGSHEYTFLLLRHTPAQYGDFHENGSAGYQIGLFVQVAGRADVVGDNLDLVTHGHLAAK